VPVLVGTYELPASMQDVPLYLQASLGSTDDPGDLKLQLNSGRDAWECVVLTIAEEGWWETPPLAGALRVSDLAYLSGRDDSPPYTRWEQGITAADIVDDIELSFWIWRDPGQRGVRPSALTINVTDPSGWLNATLGGAYRDQPARLQYVEPGAALSTAVDLGAMIVERVVPTSALERRITLRDTLARFEVGMQRRRIRPDAEAEVAFTPWPILIGPAFSCPLVLLDGVEWTYAIDSNGIQAIGRVRDRGNPFDPAADPVDYVVDALGQTLTLTNQPAGIITADAVATGIGFDGGGTPPDVLDGEGDPFDGSGFTITGWTGGIYGLSPDDAPSYVGSGRVSFPQQDVGSNPYITHDTAGTVVGNRYRVRITIVSATLPPEFAPVAKLLLCRTANPFDAVLELAEFNAYSSGFPQSIEMEFTATSVHGLTLLYKSSQEVSGAVVVEDFTIIELPPLVDDSATEDEADAAIAALALPLGEILRQGIEVRGGFLPDVWYQDSADAVHTASGHVGQGFWSAEQILLRDYIDLLLDGYTASAFKADDGRLSFVRLVAPEDETATGEIGIADILQGSDPLPTWDEMRGLTRQIGARVNEHVFRPDDLATDLDATNWRQRRKLTRQYRFVASSGAPLAPGLEHADTAEPLATRLVVLADAQREVDRVCGIASRSRSFYGPFKVRSPLRFALGQIVTLTFPDFGLEAGKKVMVVRRPTRRMADVGEITCWGLSPEETE
jgi:hypothetical protein